MASTSVICGRQRKALADINQALGTAIDPVLFNPRHANAPTGAYAALLEIILAQASMIENLSQRVAELEQKKGAKK